jgi:hypothetical protein
MQTITLGHVGRKAGGSGGEGSDGGSPERGMREPGRWLGAGPG